MNGAVAQLAEHRLCKAGVRGSIPLGSTSTFYFYRGFTVVALGRRANRHLDALTRRDHLSTSYHGFDGIPR